MRYLLILLPVLCSAQTLSIPVPLDDHSQSTQTRPFAIYPNTGALPVSNCVTGSYAEVTGSGLYRNTGVGTCSWTLLTSGSMVYPAAGVPLSTGSAWGSSYTAGTGALNLFQIGGGGWSGICGPSGGLTCSVAGQLDTSVLVPLLSVSNTWAGANDFHDITSGARIRLPSVTVSSLPSSSLNAGREFMITDGLTQCDFTSGGGTFQVLIKAKEDGSAYVAPNCSTGSGSPITAEMYPFGFPCYGCNPFGLTDLGGSLPAFTVVYQKFMVPAPGVTVNAIAMWTRSVSSYVAFSVMDSSCNIVGGTSAVIGAGGDSNFTFSSPLTLTPGIYYLGWSSDGTGQIMTTQAASATDGFYWPGLANTGESSSTYGYFYGSNLATSTAHVTMPSSCGTRTTMATGYWPAVRVH